MPLCFIQPQEAIRVVAESVGREARRQLLSEVVAAWVDEIPEDELVVHYSKAVDDLDDDDLSMLAAWQAARRAGARRPPGGGAGGPPPEGGRRPGRRRPLDARRVACGARGGPADRQQ